MEPSEEPGAAPEPKTEPKTEPEAETEGCVLCHAVVPKTGVRYVNHKPACEACVAQLTRELEAQRPDLPSCAIGLLGGLVGAAVGAAVWAVVAVVTGMEVGYIAVLVGFLAGLGVKHISRKRGVVLQAIAAAAAVAGLAAAKYFIIAHYMVAAAHDHGVEVTMYDSRILAAFPTILTETWSGFDILWVVIAVAAAFRVTRPPKVMIYG